MLKYAKKLYPRSRKKDGKKSKSKLKSKLKTSHYGEKNDEGQSVATAGQLGADVDIWESAHSQLSTSQSIGVVERRGSKEILDSSHSQQSLKAYGERQERKKSLNVKSHSQQSLKSFGERQERRKSINVNSILGNTSRPQSREGGKVTFERRTRIDVIRSSQTSVDSDLRINPRLHSRSQLVRVLSMGDNVDDTLTSSCLEKSIEDLRKMVDKERQRDWLISFRRLDPRYKINKFFNDVARGGATGIEEDISSISDGHKVPFLLKYFSRSAAFSVWRPTSNDAIRKMVTGEGAGKGLDVKGKSAKEGILSGFIPFLQIHEEKHKKEVRWPPKDGSIRIYYNTEEARKTAALELNSLSKEMATDVSEAKEMIAKTCPDEEQHELALKKLLLDVADPEVHILENYYPSRFGIDVAERVFFNAYISRNDISRCSEYQTGRPSEPAFQDMNFSCIRKYKGKGPRAVVLQTLEDKALSPKSLVVAYEEYGSVTPVLSDFDCFLVGTRQVDYVTPLSKDQVDLVKWLLTQIETILDSPITSKSWTSRWLEVLKESATKGFYPEMPEFGFGDPKSYAIMEGVVSRLQGCGAVRHGAECFNYFFPQELDERFLVISDHFEGNVPWKSVDVRELQNILCDRIEEGYTFPLNPKWILADHGWKTVYDKLMASEDKRVQKSLDVWYPPESGIRELIEDIYERFPNGFKMSNIGCDDQDVKTEGTEAMDLAEQQLKRHIIIQRAKFKLRVALRIMKMGNMSRPS